MPSSLFRQLARWVVLALALPSAAQAWQLEGRHRVSLEARDGSRTPIAALEVAPAKNGVMQFTLTLDPAHLTDFFLSMREFKCLTGEAQVQCYVRYPYPNPATISEQDLRWLEHALLFLYKDPSEFGAKLGNGLYYPLHLTERGLEGQASSIDLNAISAPPDDPGIPPYGPAERVEIEAGEIWFGTLLIE
jgi:hypothetical protein